MPLSPELHDLYQLMIMQAYSQDGVTHEEHPWLSGQTSPIDLWQLEILPGLHSALLGGPSDPVRHGEDVQHLHLTGSFSSSIISTSFDPCDVLPVLERSLTPTSTIHRRARCHTEGMDDQGSSYPAKRRHKHTRKAGMLAQPSEPLHPPPPPPHNNDCPRGAHHLHVCAGGAHVPNNDPFRPGDEDLEGQEGSDSQEDVEQEEETVDATQGLWQWRPTDDLSC